MPADQITRPLSPHIQIYRWSIAMAMSIAHRLSGLMLALGAGLVALWLFALADGGALYEAMQVGIGSGVGQGLGFLFLWAASHHALGGIRHLVQDTGRGFSLPAVQAMGWATLILAPLLALVAFWGLTR